MAAKKKPQLPKSVLDMKFMRKTKERMEKELQNIEDHEKLYSEAISKEMRHATGNFITETSFIYCEELLEGRLSFKGMNPEIEKLMVDAHKSIKNDSEMDKDVSDEILAKKMNSFRKRRVDSETPSKYNMVKRKKQFNDKVVQSALH